MYKIGILCCCCLVITACKEANQCVIHTEEGDIIIELFEKEAPTTAANFLTYVDIDAFDESSFFRVTTPENEAERAVKIEVIQGGNIPEALEKKPIVLEKTSDTGLKHLRGTLSMARAEANTATSQFFICVKDEPELDFGGPRHPDGLGFAAFGKVLEGMDIVDRINSMENEGQYLLDSVTILSIERK